MLVDALLTRTQAWAFAGGIGAIGPGLGAAIVFPREPSVFWIGALGLALGWSYHGPHLKLAHIAASVSWMSCSVMGRF